MRDRKSRTLRRKQEGKKARLEKQMGPIYAVSGRDGKVYAKGTLYELEQLGYVMKKAKRVPSEMYGG